MGIIYKITPAEWHNLLGLAGHILWCVAQQSLNGLLECFRVVSRENVLIVLSLCKYAGLFVLLMISFEASAFTPTKLRLQAANGFGFCGDRSEKDRRVFEVSTLQISEHFCKGDMDVSASGGQGLLFLASDIENMDYKENASGDQSRDNNGGGDGWAYAQNVLLQVLVLLLTSLGGYWVVVRESGGRRC